MKIKVMCACGEEGTEKDMDKRERLKKYWKRFGIELLTLEATLIQ